MLSLPSPPSTTSVNVPLLGTLTSAGPGSKSVLLSIDPATIGRLWLMFAPVTPSVMLSLAPSLVSVSCVALMAGVTAALAAAGRAKMATPAARTAAEVRILGFMPAKTHALAELFHLQNAKRAPSCDGALRARRKPAP